MTTAARTMLEREAGLSALHGALEDAIAGTGRVALVTGKAGIGKTTIVRMFQDDARARVVSGACEAPSRRVRSALFTTSPERSAARCSTLMAGRDRITILSALLAEIRSTPTLAVLEDVHWADKATLDAIAYLGRRLDSVPSRLSSGLHCADHRVSAILRKLGAGTRSEAAAEARRLGLLQDR